MNNSFVFAKHNGVHWLTSKLMYVPSFKYISAESLKKIVAFRFVISVNNLMSKEVINTS